MDIRMSNIASPMPPIRARFTSKLGIPLSGCKVYTYEPNSNIPKTTWVDIDKTVENTNPILLDSAGEADIFLDGLYRIVVKDRFGFTVYDVEKTGIAIELDASFVFYNNISQKKINDGFDSIEEMKSINSPQHQMTVLVKSFNSELKFKGGGYFSFIKDDLATPNDVNIFEGDDGNWHRLNWKNPSIYDAGITGNESDNTAKFQKLVDAATAERLSISLKGKTLKFTALDIPSDLHIYNGTLDATSSTWHLTYGRGAMMFKNTSRGAVGVDYEGQTVYAAIEERKRPDRPPAPDRDDAAFESSHRNSERHGPPRDHGTDQDDLQPDPPVGHSAPRQQSRCRAADAQGCRSAG